MNISFGKKIPIAQCQIQNIKTGKFEPATVYELDCKDESDLLETRKPKSKWEYASYIHENMSDKYRYGAFSQDFDDCCFYILQDKNGETIGMAQTEEIYEDAYDLACLDTRKGKHYTFVGQTLLATVAREVQKKSGDILSVFGAVDSAMDFYKKVCGFKIGEFDRPYISAEDIPNFIQQTEERTNAKIIDLKG